MSRSLAAQVGTGGSAREVAGSAEALHTASSPGTAESKTLLKRRDRDRGTHQFVLLSLVNSKKLPMMIELSVDELLSSF